MRRRFVDAHCHFDFAVFDGRRSQIIEQCQQQGLTALVMPGVSDANWERLRLLCDALPRLWFAPGIHPWWVNQVRESCLDELDRFLGQGHPRLVGIGECGLDRPHGELDQQYPWFEGQITLARQHGLPLLIHSVRTHDEVAQLLKRQNYTGRALIHGFSGSLQQAERFVSRGFAIGVGGVITYPRANKTRKAISALPLEALVLETDAPDMPPQGVRKGENSPLNLGINFAALCELRSETPDEVAAALWRNACQLYWPELETAPDQGLAG